METRLERIRRLFAGDYGVTALETKDVEWLIEQAEAADGMRAELESRTRAHHAAEQRELTALAELDEVRAENARQRAWIDGVMAQGACYARQRGIEWMSGNAFRTTEVGAQTSTRTTPLITRPAPFEDK